LKGQNLLASFISMKLIERLIFQELSDCEHMGLQWFIALTLVHELMVSIPSNNFVDGLTISLSMQSGGQGR
jgi:hypothetical protein